MSSESMVPPAPSGNGLFRVQVEGLPPLDLAACRGLTALARYLAVPEGGASSPRLFRDEIRFDPLVFQRLLDADSSLWEWFERGDARDGRIELLDASGAAVARWTFRRGRPTEWRGPALDATAVSLALEELEIVHEGLRREGPAPGELPAGRSDGDKIDA